jgi:hypothetical protein
MNNEASNFSIMYLPLIIRLRCCETAQLPTYLGSTLHGVLGWVLLRHSKAYRYIFDNRKFGGAAQDVVNPYIIEPPRYQAIYRPGDELCFKLILLGDAIRYAEEVVMALANARQFGIGAERKMFELTDILQGRHFGAIWQNDKLSMSASTSETLSAGPQGKPVWCSIHLMTPLRIRRGGALLLKPDFPTIIRSITKRIQALTERYGGYVNLANLSAVSDLSSEIRATSSSLYLNQMSRYSNRRNEKVDLSGLLGAMTFEGDLAPFTSWLNAARILHIGRNSTFGCGQLDVVFS